MLQKVNFQPGFNKQVTATGGEGQWIGGDYVRFRYATPEKVGGWAQLGDSTLTGRNTALHHFVNASGKKRLQKTIWLFFFPFFPVLVFYFIYCIL